jgi:phosphatidylserine/phosphatidylglycerophosphate/cardiolipin synthase-like enzyme
VGAVISVRAWANNEVVFIAWNTDGRIDGCLGFEVTRIYLDPDGNTIKLPDGSEDRVKCAAWVAFKGQRNPNWLPQDTGVWPVQKFSWRDLTVRKKRRSMKRRPSEVNVRYEVRPVGDWREGLPRVPSNGLEYADVVVRDAKGRPVRDVDGKEMREHVKAYTGAERPLGYLAPAARSNAVFVTTRRGAFRSTFTNGILAAQWLRNVLNEDGVIEKDELYNKICAPGDPHRNYLAGDVIPLIREMLQRPGDFYLALYELEDKELEDLLVDNAQRIHVILANSGRGEGDAWDARNKPARKRLVDARVDIHHRMFNNSIHIGHNKFVVHVPEAGGSKSVLTGSTNWTSTGLAGQTNNALLIEDDTVAGQFLEYWMHLRDDPLPLPRPMGKEMKDNQQGMALRGSDQVQLPVRNVEGSAVQAWFSPNMPQRKKPTGGANPPPVPPDLADVYRCIRFAREAVLFLAFYPGAAGKDCIIGEVIDIGTKDRSLLVLGAVSSVQAMPNYVAQKKDAGGGIIVKGRSPATYDNGNVSIVRATAVEDAMLLGDLGAEQLTARGNVGAIIHDKLVVIDPRLDECVVVLGSHNLGFKASYSNDENMLIIRGNKDLAAAYAVHILDVYDHYRFRAYETERQTNGGKKWSGFLDTNDGWQDDYVKGLKGAAARYFAR